MEVSRHKEERSLKNKVLSTPVIVLGSIILMVGISLLGFTEALSATQTQSTSSGTTRSEVEIFCLSIGCIIGFIGFLFLLIGIIRTVKSIHELEASENEYQKLRSQLQSLEVRESR